MATVLGLALKINADASAVEPELSKVDKALAGLGQKADSVAALFDQFKESTSGAGAVQESVRQQLDQLAQALQDGGLDAQEYAAAFAAVEASARELAGVFADGARTTAQFATEQEKAGSKIEQLAKQFQAGAIEGPAFERALSAIAGVDLTSTDEGRRFLEGLSAAAKTGGVDALRAAADLEKLGQSGESLEKSIEKPKLKLNELSGIFAALPGPIGEIAGRFSGLVSAGEGLSRVFAGGLSGGLSSLAGTVTALINPFTLAAAGVAAFGAAASAIASGLGNLSGRVEELQNTAARLGTSFEFVQVLDEAAKRSGLSIEQLADGLQKFEVNISKAREGGNDTAEAFDRLGISQQELINTDPSELAGRVADALGGIEDPAERARLATELLGKSGLELLPAFRTVDEAQEALDRFSKSISSVDKERLEGVDKSFDDIKTSLQGLGQNLLTPFAGLADGVASAIADAIGGFTNLLEPFLDRISPFLDAIGEGFEAAGEIIYDTATTVGAILETLFSVIERLGTIVGAAVSETIDYFTDLLTQFSEFTGLGGVISSVASGIAGAFSNLWEGIKQVVGQVGGFIETVLQFAEDWLGIERGVDAANDAYREQASIVKQTEEASRKKAKAEEEAAQKAIEANTKIVDSLLEQLDIDEQFGGDNQRAKAAKNVQAVEEEIGRLEADLQEARESGDREAIARVTQRLQRLDQILAQEQDIASGAAADRKRAADEQQKLDKEREDARKKLEDDFRKAVADNAKEIDSLERKLSEERFEIERDRIEELNQLRLGGLEIGDIREGGADVFQDLLGGREDKAIAEYKKQLDELKGLRDDLKKAQAKKAEILRGAPV